MTSAAVQVPVSLLLSPDLPPTAKLIWMASRLHPVTGQPRSAAASLCAATGLSRPTVLKGTAQLAAAGWALTAAAPPGAVAPVPGELLTSTRLGTQARVLFGMLLLTPGFHHPFGRITYEALATLARASEKTVARALNELAHAEWISLARANRLAPIDFELTLPGLAQGLTELARAQRRFSKAEHVGEGLMREYLSLLIDSDYYQDNVYPGFLRNPRTEELLQFDRYYPPDVAFELNGPQHFHPTAKFTAEQVREQRERDYIKMGICVERGITLVIILPEDLTLHRIREKVGHLLPTRDLGGHELLIDFLESESAPYRRFAAKL